MRAFGLRSDSPARRPLRPVRVTAMFRRTDDRTLQRPMAGHAEPAPRNLRGALGIRRGIQGSPKDLEYESKTQAALPFHGFGRRNPRPRRTWSGRRPTLVEALPSQPAPPMLDPSRSVAQSGSASHWGCGGRRFESCRSDQSHRDRRGVHPQRRPRLPNAPVALMATRMEGDIMVGRLGRTPLAASGTLAPPALRNTAEDRGIRAFAPLPAPAGPRGCRRPRPAAPTTPLSGPIPGGPSVPGVADMRGPVA